MFSTTELEKKDAPDGGRGMMISPESCHVASAESTTQRSPTVLEHIQTASQWAASKEWFEEEISRHNFSESQIRVLLELSRHSYGCCKPTAIYPSLGSLAAAAGVDASNFTRVLDSLYPWNLKKCPQGIGVILPKSNDQGYEFALQPHAKLWRNITGLRSRAEYEANREVCRRFAFNADKYQWLIPPEKSLLEAASSIPARQFDESPETGGQTGLPLSRQNDESVDPGKAERTAFSRQIDERQLAATSFNKSTDIKLAAASLEITPENALAWLLSADTAGEWNQRGVEIFKAEWMKLLTKDPAFVLAELRPSLLRSLSSKNPARKPIAWMAQKARAFGKFDLPSSP